MNDDLRTEIDALLDRGEHYRAWARLRDALATDAAPHLAHLAAAVADRLDPRAADLRPARVALLSSFTLDPIVPVLQARALAARVALESYVGPFNAWTQEALSAGSGLRRFEPDVVVLALQPEDLVPALTDRFLQLEAAAVRGEIDEAVAALERFLVALRAWSRARVLVHSLPPPIVPALGMLDHVRPDGQGAAFRELNAAWTAAARRVPDVWIVDTERLVREVGWWSWHDPRLAALARMPLAMPALARLAEEYAAYVAAFLGLTKKVLVLDLDGTLWGGILGEDGFDGIQVGTDYPGVAFAALQRVVAGLHDRGVLLAIASKNAAADAAEVLERHPGMVLRPQHFAATRINWNDKAQSLAELSEELGIGLDAFVFVDDSAAECERVRQALPQVLTVHLADEPSRRPGRLARLRAFDGVAATAEDRARSASYRAAQERKRLQARLPSLAEFYASLAMRLTVQRLEASGLARAAQLSQRTNQFNLTTRRYTEGDLARLAASAEYELYTARLSDRLGDDGVVALLVLDTRGPAVEIETLLMSCRVIGRSVEAALLTFVLRRARALGATAVLGVYRPTPKNGIVADLYAGQGFTRVDDRPDGTVWRLTAEAFDRPFPPWLALTLPTPGSAATSPAEAER
jgi:FkbH-like protein